MSRRSPKYCSSARFGQWCSPRGRMCARCEPRGHLMSESHGIAYRGVRARVREIVEGTDPSALQRVVPATPKWTGHDVLAHMVGVPNDVVHGRMEGLASESWTQAQVDARTSA